MSNEIIIGIAQKLNKTFGFIVYTDSVKQGFVEPCFFVQIVESSNRRIIADRFLISRIFDIHYFSRSKHIDDLLLIADKLMDTLNTITVDGVDIRGLQMSYKIVDKTLHFMVCYENFILKSKILGEKMNNLEKIKGDIK